jgi:cytochrome c556
MTMRRLLPLTALLVAVAAAGCGSSDAPSADDAKSAYESVRTQIVDLGGSIGGAINGASRSTDSQLSETFSSLKERGRSAVARLDDLQVPDSLDDERQALRDALDKGSDDLADIATAAKASDADAARTAAQQLVSDSQDIRDARDKFERALDDATK